VNLLRPLAFAAALSVTGCMATFETHDALIGGDDVEPSVVRHVVFYALLPALLAIDVATSPFQYVYVITHAK
jgi:hypothetical protein